MEGGAYGHAESKRRLERRAGAEKERVLSNPCPPSGRSHLGTLTNLPRSLVSITPSATAKRKRRRISKSTSARFTPDAVGTHSRSLYSESSRCVSSSILVAAHARSAPDIAYRMPRTVEP
eukprot:654401-Rhodomonas_salina.1